MRQDRPLAWCVGAVEYGAADGEGVGPGLPHDGDDAQAAASRLAYEIKVYIGTSATIDLRPSGGIERSLGKAKRVVDQRRM